MEGGVHDELFFNVRFFRRVWPRREEDGGK